MSFRGPWIRRLAGERAGTSAVEFALVVPVLITFVFGIWYLGWAVNCGGEVRHAVEMGSRIYITNPNATLSDLSTAVASHLIDVSVNNINLAVATTTAGSATSEHITWTYNTTAPIPLLNVPIAFTGNVDVPLATP